MTHQPHQWVSVGEASRRLNVSPSTVRRMIEAGQLVGEREIIGGSRDRYRVRFDAPETPQDAPGEASDAPPPPSTPDASESPTDAPAAVAGLLAELRAMRQEHASERAADASRIATLYAENAGLRERVGRAEAGAASARASAEALQVELDRLRARPGWRALWPW